MAKVKFGMYIVDGRGKQGGHVMTKNRQGAAVRTKVTPINRRSTSQQNQRASFTLRSQAWRSLTQAQRDAWSSAAPDFVKHNIFGDSYSPTGKNLHMLINQNLILVGAAAVSSPPVATAPTSLTSMTIGTNTNAAQTIVFAASPVAANNAVLLYATRPLSAGIGSAGARYRLVAVMDAAETTPYDSFAEYEAKFGTPITGKKIFYKAVTIQKVSGIRSGSLSDDSITA